MQRLLHIALLAAVTHASCVFPTEYGTAVAQAPTSRPALANAELDAKLQRMLRYDVPLVAADTLALRLSEARGPKPLLLDVREADEYAVSHLPGAVRVEPGSDLPANLDSARAWLATAEAQLPDPHGYKRALAEVMAAFGEL